MAKNRNTEYWEKRALELEKIKDTRVRATQKDLHKINRDISKRMKRNIHYWVSRFARDNGLTYAEAMRKLSPEEIKEFRMDVDEYIIEASKITDGTPDEKLLKIANASTSYHFTRLELLKIQLINSVSEFISKENDLIFNFLEDLYKDIYYRNTYDIAKGIGAELNLFTPNEYAIKLLVKKPWTEDGLEFSERLWGPHKDKLVKELDKSLKDSIARGENAIKMSDRLADTMGVRKDHAEALLHTESARIAEEARFDNYKDLGVEKYIIVATLDHKTSDICRRMDGKAFLVKDKKVGDTYPPFHVRCRTTTAPYDLDEHSIGPRAARDKNGKTIYVPKDMTYPEFHKKYIESDKEYSALEKAWKNRHSDKKLHKKYRKIYGKDIPKSFEDFQKLKYNNSKELEDIKFRHKLKESVFPSEKSLSGHFEKHRGKLGIDSKDEYLKQAQELLGKKESENISRYRTKNGRVVAYDNINNRIVIYSDGKIRSYMSPEKGVDYYKEQYEKDVNG
ncbi:MAG: minor capsid protein [Peptostreptococcus sp.]|uniref:minor capsid protein n=1 Tax=Peptostreptococcus sp. TaxID=1262 RepID=UPI0029091087|nr:minor capsid protein [Peptostreptococcus sp.]MDU5681001.1 minor capsid protein [Peptostreptococcus sp.]MDU5737920.1 minor capsid protein [Peptostreptococcus sp.]